MNDKLKIFSGRSNVPLSNDIANHLGKELGQLSIKTFSDGELWLQFEENIRGAMFSLYSQPIAPQKILWN